MASTTSNDVLMGEFLSMWTASGNSDGFTVSFYERDEPHELDLINRMAANWRELQKAS